MSITDELRKEVRGYGRYVYTTPQADCLTAIAVRIDEKVADMQAFCDRLREAAEGREDVTLWGVDYVALPVDADGEPWHVGDLVIGEVNPTNPKEVERMLWYGIDSGWQLETGTIIYPCPERPRHYHAPTVEGILREFAEKMAENTAMYVAESWDADERDEADAAAVAEYAKRLRLAGDGE